MMHSNGGTLGEIVGRTCTHGAFSEKERNLGGWGETQNRNKSRFSISANLLIFLLAEYIQLFHV